MILETIAIIGGMGVTAAISSAFTYFGTKKYYTSHRDDQENVKVVQEETDITEIDGTIRHTTKTEYKMKSARHAQEAEHSTHSQNGAPEVPLALVQSANNLLQFITPGGTPAARSPLSQIRALSSSQMSEQGDTFAALGSANIPGQGLQFFQEDPLGYRSPLFTKPTISLSARSSPLSSRDNSPSGSPQASPEGSPSTSPLSSRRDLNDLSSQKNYSKTSSSNSPATKSKVFKFNKKQEEAIRKLSADNNNREDNFEDAPERASPVAKIKKLQPSKSATENGQHEKYNIEHSQSNSFPSLKNSSFNEEGNKAPQGAKYKPSNSKISPHTSPKPSPKSVNMSIKFRQEADKDPLDMNASALANAARGEMESAASRYATSVLSAGLSNINAHADSILQAAEPISTFAVKLVLNNLNQPADLSVSLQSELAGDKSED